MEERGSDAAKILCAPWQSEQTAALFPAATARACALSRYVPTGRTTGMPKRCVSSMFAWQRAHVTARLDQCAADLASAYDSMPWMFPWQSPQEAASVVPW